MSMNAQQILVYIYQNLQDIYQDLLLDIYQTWWISSGIYFMLGAMR